MPAKRPRFFEKTYEGRRFAGIVTENGPYVLDITANRCSALYQSIIVTNGRVQWWVAEGDIFNSRIPLNSLSAAARRELAYDFGLSFASIATLSPIIESERSHSAAAVEGLIHWMEENRGFVKQRGGDDKLKLDWASMIECWKFKREIRSNLRRNLRRRGIDDKQRDLAQAGKTRAKVS
jgi:hypothetical protein